MDLSIIDIDIYNLNKDQAVRVARDYNVKLPSDLSSQTLPDLRQKLALIRDIFIKAQRDPDFKRVLTTLLNDNILSDVDGKEYPQLLRYSEILESVYDTVDNSQQANTLNTDSQGLGSDVNKLSLLAKDNPCTLHEYDNKAIIEHEHLLTLKNQQTVADLTQNANPERNYYIPTVNETSEPRVNIGISKINNTLIDNMANNTSNENIPLIKPTVFSGHAHENAQEFLKKYEISARCNRWSERTKLDLFGTYTSGTAYKWWSNFTDLNPGTDWETLKTNFKKAFGHSGLLLDLQTTLDAKIQTENESPLQFFFEIHNLCRQINPDMHEDQIINYTLKGLRPVYFDEVVRMEHNNLREFQDNLSKLEARFQLKQQNTRKYNLHYGYDYVQSITPSNNTPNFVHESKEKNIRFDDAAVRSNYRSTDRSKTPELLNAITDLTKAVSLLNRRDCSRDRKEKNEVNTMPSYPRYARDFHNYSQPRRDSFNWRRQSPHRESEGEGNNGLKRYVTPSRNYSQRNSYSFDRKRDTLTGERQGNRNWNSSYSSSNVRYNCDICRMDNHFTKNCFYNSKNSSSPRRHSNNFRYTSNQACRDNPNTRFTSPRRSVSPFPKNAPLGGGR